MSGDAFSALIDPTREITEIRRRLAAIDAKLDKLLEAKMITQAEYNAYYNECLRSPNVDRDEAIKRTNMHFGYGDSTAAKFPVTDEDLPPHVKPDDDEKPEQQ